ncbi:hypothetical protein Q7P37_007746 [Cladosporium fusiforme]
MVLFKRKPVTIIAQPQNVKEDAEVWVVPETGEIFTEYEKYLKRYGPTIELKKFTDAINGKSGLTYADAVASEQSQSLAEIENVFPDVLRDPILRKVQFSTIGRMDELVNWVYNEFKREFFPGEDVLVTLQDRDIMTSGSIREKAKFPMIKGPDGSVQRNAFARYFIRLHDSPGDEALVDEQHVRRDRKVYSKLNLRAFLKNSLNREPYLHAPWLVKESLAIHYRLPMAIPEHLLRDSHVLANRDQMHQMKAPRVRHPKNMAPEEVARMQQEAHAQQQMQRQHGGPLPHHPIRQPQVAPTPPKPAPPPIKYPIEDLDVEPKKNTGPRPQLSFLTDEMSHFVTNGRAQRPERIQMETVGMLLETWNTLNVQCEVYEIDSFTFDDFVDAMGFKTESENTTCQLLDEAFCAVMKQLVNENGKLEVNMPKMPEEEEEEEDESDDAVDDSTVSTPVADVPARSTRSRLSHVENASEQPPSPTSTPAKLHKAPDALAGFDWVEALDLRDMEGGNWQLILVGILNQLSHAPNFKAICDKVLAYLVPLNMDPSKENIKYQFKTMDINLRAAALQPMTMLSATTKALKKFLEDCSEDQTEVRKRKMEHQREKKVAMESLAYKDRDRKAAQEELALKEEQVLRIPELFPELPAEATGGSSEPEDETAASRRSSRKRKRGAEMTPQEKERQDKIDAVKTAAEKQKKEHQALVRDCDVLRNSILELEAQINECDGDLREADVQRTKMLGKDRYCNRYYWFERNGQPFGGLPNSSTAHHGYANGRIWVQGPDNMERDGFIDLEKDEQNAYKARFGMTVPERRKLEEGPSSLLNANEWGYYEEPAVLDALISWLDDRGEREKRLRKELYEWRDKIAKYMRAHKDFMDTEAAKKLEAEEEPKKGIATRRQAEQEKAEAGERCLRWKNLMGEATNNHLHSENPPAKKTKKNPQKAAAGVAINSRVSRSRTK